MAVIGIIGLAGSGKDTLCNALLKQLPGFSRYAYADPLKEFTMCVLPLNRQQCYDVVAKETEIEFVIDHNKLKQAFELWFSTIAPCYIITHRSPEYYFQAFMGALSTEYKTKNAWWVADILALLGINHDYVFKTTPRKLLQLIGTDFFRRHVDENFWINLAPKSNIIVSDVRFENEIDHILHNDGIMVKIVDPALNEISSSSHVSESLSKQDIECDITVINDKTKGIEALDASAALIINKLKNKW
jgi:hypothetical protein